MCPFQGGIKFIDTLNFFFLGLHEEAKGFFPHFYNISTLQQYMGVMPERHYYDPHGIKPKHKAEFERWHQAQVDSHKVFNLQAKILKYCQSDKAILKKASMLFVRELRGICGFHPLQTMHCHCLRLQQGLPLPLDASPYHCCGAPTQLESAHVTIPNCTRMVVSLRIHYFQTHRW